MITNNFELNKFEEVFKLVIENVFENFKINNIVQNSRMNLFKKNL